MNITEECDFPADTTHQMRLVKHTLPLSFSLSNSTHRDKQWVTCLPLLLGRHLTWYSEQFNTEEWLYSGLLHTPLHCRVVEILQYWWLALPLRGGGLKLHYQGLIQDFFAGGNVDARYRLYIACITDHYNSIIICTVAYVVLQLR